ncbi:DUF1839 family protein [Stappia taiwanensis]|uniref:DUF1839 family protein n=1 Tax=Stappia taiwanensis TaxID=992267 RepID=A0A838Y0V2_9HYPH|nr:DUF1839 family protein [Stappia taiwanensis]MBA4612590.1 DUF1839 family protein [Stappia taiwanensis]GGE89267.1 hypothetical protein GCM10007285_15920 [Stappia taiwanensis]
MITRLAALRPDGYQPHALHAATRIWPETNCYVDLWIEVLHALGQTPEAMLGFTLTQDFEGDQFTFFKVPLEDLETLYGIRAQELAIYDRTENHVAEQIARGRLCLVEVDSYFLPDTHGVGYRSEHGKTTVAITALDPAERRMTYFHNGGLFSLEGDDFDGVFQRGAFAQPLPFLPYTEFSKLPAETAPAAELRPLAMGLLTEHFRRRPDTNPFTAYAARFAADIEALADRPFEDFHKYAFNTLRQAGANFELAGEHLAWLFPDGQLAAEAEAARGIAESCKSLQFLLARALARKRFAGLTEALQPPAAAWDRLMQGLEEKLPTLSADAAGRAA